jgi:hypothetical protein
MAKFYGSVGYGTTMVETSPGIYEETQIEKSYRGDILRNNRRLEPGESINDKIAVNNLISIVADAYALQNFFAIRYIKWMGASWKVTNVEVQRPRLILTIGGVYNNGNET